MICKLMIAAASAAVLMASPTAFAQGQFGTADEAKAMLVKAAAAVKADKNPVAIEVTVLPYDNITTVEPDA